MFIALQVRTAAYTSALAAHFQSTPPLDLLDHDIISFFIVTINQQIYISLLNLILFSWSLSPSLTHWLLGLLQMSP